MSNALELQQLYRRGLDAVETSNDHEMQERLRQDDARFVELKEQMQQALDKAGIPEELRPFAKWSKYRIFLLIPECLPIMVHLFSSESSYAVPNVSYNPDKGKVQYVGHAYSGSEIWVAIGIARREYLRQQALAEFAIDAYPSPMYHSWDIKPKGFYHPVESSEWAV